jgi:membrane associated rhomboid family serine protease/TolA-binding protein
MMIFLPLGHDKEIFRFPYVTAGIIVVCLGVQIYTAATSPSDEELEQMHKEEMLLRTRIFVKYGREWMKKHQPQGQKTPESVHEVMRLLAQARGARQRFFKDFENGRVVPTDHPDYRALMEIARKKERAMGPLALGFRPGAPLYTLITYAFIHGGWFHLIGNMLFLYLCGCNMEDRWGAVVWILLYVLGGAAAGLAWRSFHPQTDQYLVGASGAIAAAMGAFLIINHKAYIRIGYFIMIVIRPVWGVFEMRAYWALPLWLVQQLLGVMTEEQFTPVAYTAHVGGFIFGMGTAVVIKLLGFDRRLQSAAVEKATIFSQDPRYLAGLKQLEQGDREAAEATLERLLQDKPDHLDAAMELYRAKQDPAEATAAAARALVLAKRSGDMNTPINIYKDLNQRHEKPPWDDRSLFAVGECFEHKGDFAAAVSVYEHLLELHPRSPVAPRAALNIAQIMADKLKQSARARNVLQQVIQHFEGTPFADRARQMLEDLPEPIEPSA